MPATHTSMANDDPQTDLKKRARRRLVGAAALALLAIIVLPMIMDPEIEPAGDDIQVRIPSQESDTATTRAIEPIAVAPIEKIEEIAPAPRVAAPSPAEAPLPASQSSVPAREAPTAEAPKSDAPAAQPTNEASRVKEILAGNVETAAPAAGPAYFVQVGAFSNANSADALSKKIRDQGFEAYTRKIGSTTRVRVGPYPDRKSADGAAARLARQGYKGVVMQRG